MKDEIPQTTPNAGFQSEVADWMLTCFGEEITADRLERADRFIEESLELAQTMPQFTADRAHALVDYVFGRPVGEVGQEVGGVMVTLAAMCNVSDIKINDEAERELARIWTKVEAIRAKQAAKPTGSALPIPAPDLARKAASADAMAEAADELANAESAYRLCHDLKGDGHIETGRAWDYMRKCGDHVRQALATHRSRQMVEVTWDDIWQSIKRAMLKSAGPYYDEVAKHCIDPHLTAHRLSAYAPDKVTPEVKEAAARAINDIKGCEGYSYDAFCVAAAEAAILAAFAVLRGDDNR
jgi:NTP pyrophosphatase (non-canonical NTP hydrolase)